MNSEKFETIEFNSIDDMHASQFVDLFSRHLPKNAKIEDPDPEGDTRHMKISRIPASEIKRIRKMIEDNGGTIIKSKDNLH